MDCASVHARAPTAAAMSLIDCIAPVTNVLADDMVRKFLLYSTSESDLSLLSSRIHVQHSFAGMMSNSMLQGCTSMMPPQITRLFNANWCLLPAYSFGKYSALLFIKEAAYRSPECSAWPLNNTIGDFTSRSVIVRGVRNDDTGEIVAINSEQGSDHAFCMVMLNDRMSGKRRMRAFFRADVSALRTSWSQPELVAITVPYLVKMDEQAVCASCFGVCTCVLPPVVRAQHPLDFAHARHNMMRQVGTFTATGTSLQLQSGTVVEIKPQCTMLGEMVGGNVPGTVSRMLNWAISRSLALALSAAAPTRAPLPIGLVQAAYQAMRDAVAVDDTATRATNSFPTVPANDATTVEPVDPFGAGSSNSVPQQSFRGSGSDIGLLANAVGQMPELVQNGPNLTGQTIGGGEASVSSFPLKRSLFVDVGFGPLLDSAVCGNTGTHVDTTDVDQVLGVSVPAAPTLANGGNACGDNNSDGYSSPAQQAPTPVILPAPSTQPTIAVVPEKRMTSEEEKELRRKLRNRESAARSNLKKQKRMADLKKNIAEQKQSAEKLRARLQSLRKENTALRKLVDSLGHG